MNKWLRLIILVLLCLLLLGLGRGNLKGSYVMVLNTPSYPEALDILEELNDKGYGDVVRYEGTRPIIILETDVKKVTKKNYLGLAWRLPGNCIIFIHNNLKKEVFRHVLIHEYIHCFNINHSNDELDIMAEYYNPKYKENSINKYLKRIQQIYE